MKMVRRKDNKGRVLQKGESQRKDGSYVYQYTDLQGKENPYMRKICLTYARKSEKQ